MIFVGVKEVLGLALVLSKNHIINVLCRCLGLELNVYNFELWGVNLKKWKLMRKIENLMM